MSGDTILCNQARLIQFCVNNQKPLRSQVIYIFAINNVHTHKIIIFESGVAEETEETENGGVSLTVS